MNLSILNPFRLKYEFSFKVCQCQIDVFQDSPSITCTVVIICDDEWVGVKQ
jgi:hypothetical protein